MTAATAVPPPEIQPLGASILAQPLLKVADRCDTGCNAQALVRVGHPTHGILDFCQHHYDRFAVSLLADGFTVVEQVAVPK